MKNALIVDDTKNIRLLLSKCLENENFNVFLATNANEALELVSTNNFEVAFIDIKMPNMSGTALLEELRCRGYEFPVIIMTAFGTIKNAVTTTKLGAKVYLQKPFTANTIRKTLLEIFPENKLDSDKSDKEKSVSIDNKLTKVKEGLYQNPLNEKLYENLGNILIDLGESEKGKLFKELSLKLLDLK
ncbi:response regulator [Clostridium sardiniense]|uniref:response regulator n=1 Tax=Clostridium sardiniense TaxID=29369 RepID=UPI001956E12C|nr:response regulator [Clostridium sardiniense]MBM7833538.1 DNA-binding NtrC family response regulator [Clostridium sardiniense]